MPEIQEKYTLKEAPEVKGNWLIGSGYDLASDPLGFIQKSREQYGNIFRIRTHVHDILALTKPEYVQHVLVNNNRNYHKSFGYEVLSLFLGKGLLTSEGDFWMKQRRLAQPAFHRQKLAAITDSMVSATEEMAEKWQQFKKQGKTIDITHEMNEIALVIVSRALFGADVTGEIDVVREAMTEVNEFGIARIRSLLKLPLWVPTPAHVRYKNAAAKLDRVIYRIIEERRKSKTEYNDLLSMLMAATDEETGEGMSDKQLRDEVMTLFIAGHETTANALSWLWYLLDQNPNVREQLEKELKEVLNGNSPNFEDLRNLKYTRQVIDETLRHRPPAWVIGRRPVEDDEIDGYRIPKGHNVLLGVYEIHHHPDYWENPEAFDPDRFAEENKENIPKYAYFPFGGGPRLCIGNNFALMEMQVVISILAQQFQLQAKANQEVVPEPLITLRPKGGIQMQFA